MPATTYDELTGRNIRAEMARHRRTQDGLAKALNVTQPTVSAWLAGKSPWRMSVLVEVADYLGVPLAVLLPTPDALAAASTASVAATAEADAA